MSDEGRPTFVGRVGTPTVVAVVALLVVAIVWLAAEALLVLFAGVLLAVALHAPTAYLARRTKAPRALAFTVVLAVFAAVVAGLVALFESQLVGPTGELARQLPGAIAEARDRVAQEPWGPWLLERIGGGEDGAGGASLASLLTGTASSLGDVAVKLVIVLFTGTFLAANPAMYRDGTLRLVPGPRRRRARAVADEVGRTLRGWILGRIVAMTLVGIVIWLGLRLLGVPAAGGLALVGGTLEFIPFVGPVVAFVPAALLALTQGVPVVAAVLVLFVAIYQLEGNLITPLVQRRTALVPPALTVAAIFVGGTMFGATGMLVATPLVATALVLVKMLYLHDVLGQSIELLGGREEGGEAGAAPR